MYILSNKNKVLGACIILDKNMMKTVSDIVGINFYLLPSSIHEWLVVPESPDLTRADLADMVRDVNASVVSQEERLSDNVYTYSLEEGIKMA